jgi:hypothetical protein
MHYGSQQQRSSGRPAGSGGVRELIVPNPKLKLLDQVRKVMRLKRLKVEG